MLLEKFPPMIGTASPNLLGGAHGGNYQHGRTARGLVGGGGALLVCGAGGEEAHPRRAVPGARPLRNPDQLRVRAPSSPGLVVTFLTSASGDLSVEFQQS